MYFQVASNFSAASEGEAPRALLIEDNWNDWFQFKTLYTLYVFDADGEMHKIGGVKIGQFEMKPGQARPDLPEEFEALDENFFSLGQDDSYYDHLTKLVPELSDGILRALRDLPFADPAIFDAALKEQVTIVSLLRSVTKATVIGQFRRIARGGARLSEYHFKYHSVAIGRSKKPSAVFSFDVQPDSQPPTNIHVIIGRNGVGKTHLLDAMSKALVRQDGNSAENGRFELLGSDSGDGLFANLVSVAFSAFDPFEPLASDYQRRNAEVKYSYIGLKRMAKPEEKKVLPPKSPQRLSKEFMESAQMCREGARASRWSRALKLLESDPLFKDAQVATFAPADDSTAPSSNSTSGTFSRLSSGHKIVLLTITRLVETVAERTLVLLDEPEAHLHPPLLSAFIRALSDLLVNRNGVAIIATHSPVVLQEVPRSCVWKLRRSGAILVAERPEIETFGENVGILTREVFGLEVTESGFHRLLTESISGTRSYEQVMRQFNGELGGEAKAIVRGLLADRDEEDT